MVMAPGSPNDLQAKFKAGPCSSRRLLQVRAGSLKLFILKITVASLRCSGMASCKVTFCHLPDSDRNQPARFHELLKMMCLK